MISKVVFEAWQNLMCMLRDGLHSTVAKNAASLYVIQFSYYFLPLIMVPYLVRALGPSGYGLVAFGQSLIAYFTIFADYGFALSATRKISLEKDDILAVSRTASHVWAAKALLGIPGLMVLLIAIASVPKLHEISTLLLILYGVVVGNVLFPTWLFQGMEKMVAISVINLIMQIFILVGVFTLVHRPEDYIIYAGLISLGSILSGLVGACLAVFMFKLQLVLPTRKGILKALQEGWVLFLSMASVSLYTAGNAFILGILTNITVVGYYSGAEKIVKAVLGLLGPIAQASYPRFSRLALESKALALQWGGRMLALLGGIGLILSLMLFIGAPFIVQIVLGPEYEPSIMVIRILAALPFLVAISNVLGIQLMLPFGKDRAFTFILFLAGFINIGLSIPLASRWNESGMAAAVLVSEIFVTVIMFIYLWKIQLNPLHNNFIKGGD
jgi:polysaccharide transporter, PST family